jgi:hypothetical protein
VSWPIISWWAGATSRSSTRLGLTDRPAEIVAVVGEVAKVLSGLEGVGRQSADDRPAGQRRSARHAALDKGRLRRVQANARPCVIRQIGCPSASSLPKERKGNVARTVVSAASRHKCAPCRRQTVRANLSGRPRLPVDVIRLGLRVYSCFARGPSIVQKVVIQRGVEFTGETLRMLCEHLLVKATGQGHNCKC